MRHVVLAFVILVTLTGSGCGTFMGAPSAPPSDLAYGRYAASPGPAGIALKRRVPAPRRPRCEDRAAGIAVRHGDRLLPLRAAEAASVRAKLVHWYWTELRSFARHTPGAAAAVAALSPQALSVSIGNGTATFYLDGYRLVDGSTREVRRFRNGRPDRGEASLVDLTGSSNARVPIPTLGSHAGRTLELTGSGARCVAERSPADEAAVSAALTALSIATQD